MIWLGHMFFGPPQAGRISRCLSYGIAVLLCGGHLGGADASAPPFPFILHTLHVPPLSFGVRLLTSNRSVMRSTTTHDDPEKDIPDPIQAQNGLKRLNGDLKTSKIKPCRMV